MSYLYRFLSFYLFFLGALVLVAVGLVCWFYAPQSKQDTIILIPKRASLREISHLFVEKKIVNSAHLFHGFAYLIGKWPKIKAGEYNIPAHSSPVKILHILEEGKVILHPFTVIEGESSANVVQRLLRDNRFEGACLLPGEGTLLPETYSFPRGTHRQYILNIIQKMMKKTVEDLWKKRPLICPLKSSQEMVILASIVEKETALEKEKPFVSAVFLNRLIQGMPLQADPTVIYALTLGKNPLGRPLKELDLKINSPYNTYLFRGLPPSPIGNPGLSAMKAALYPKAVSYLYFVADGSGGHVFATSLKDHQKNHQAWRKLQRAKAD